MKSRKRKHVVERLPFIMVGDEALALKYECVICRIKIMYGTRCFAHRNTKITENNGRKRLKYNP